MIASGLFLETRRASLTLVLMNLSGTEGNVLQYWYAELCVGAPGLECFPLSVGKGDWLGFIGLYLAAI